MKKKADFKEVQNKSMESSDVFQRLMGTNKISDYTIKERATPYYPMIQTLETKFSRFDEASSNFPILRLPRSVKASKKYKKSARFKEKLSKTPIPSLEIKKKIKPISEDFDFSPSSAYIFEYNMQNLGPGSYSYRKNEISGGGISLIPRFAMSPVEKAEEYLHLKIKINEDLPAISRNMNLAPSISLHKRQKIEVDKKVKDFEESVHKLTKKYIVQLEKEQKVKKYKEKINRFEWRLQGSQIVKNKSTWLILSAAIGISTLLKYKIIKRKKFKKNAFLTFCIIVLICRFVGKLKRILFKFRYKKLVNHLKKRAHFMRTWLANRKAIHRLIIYDIVDKFSMTNYMQHFMIQFTKKVVQVQRGFREILVLKKVRFNAIMMCHKRNQKKLTGKPKPINIKKNIHHQTNFTEVEVSHFYKQCVRRYLKQKEKYKEMLKKYKNNAEEFILQNGTIEGFSEIIPKKPVLRLYSYFSHAVLMLKRNNTRKLTHETESPSKIQA
ncbi:hypothetical protein SteCoe_18419 [Stentor coeruleus]|uniref:Uncharacterized protein n=1 Tax=Stentor coeruleus TaxID=5963 RepID=A0A1R2BWK9_9CILI|nr:hypothetical protein SteCoe_18419 [Stentor coeruleus]